MNYFELLLPHRVNSCPEITNGFSVMHLNIRSIRNKSDDLDYLLQSMSCNFYVVLLTETWAVYDADFKNIPGYAHHHLNRPSRGGGVAFYVKQKFKVELVPEFSLITPDYEILTAKINGKIVSVVYRPPSGNIIVFLRFFEMFLDSCCLQNCMAVNGGDFNINVMDLTGAASDFMSVISTNGFQNLIKTPTRVTASSTSTLDLFIVDVASIVNCAGTIACDISDHCAIFACFSFQTDDRACNRCVYSYQCMSEQALCLFRDCVLNADWSAVLACPEPDQSYELFITSIKEIYDRCFPWKTKVKNVKLRKPWITPEHTKMIKRKSKLFKRFMVTRDPVDLKVFKAYRNKLNKELRRSKSAFQNCFFEKKQKQLEIVLEISKRHISKEE